MDPRGKVQVIQTLALPAKCAVCHAPADGIKQFVDFQLQIDMYGAVNFCVECLVPVAEACGFIPTKEFSDLAEVLQIALDRGIELEKDRDNLRELLDGLLAYSPTPSAVSVSDLKPQLEPSIPEPTDSQSGSTEAESESSESDSESGQRDVSETTEHDESDTEFNI